MLLFMGSIKK